VNLVDVKDAAAIVSLVEGKIGAVQWSSKNEEGHRFSFIIFAFVAAFIKRVCVFVMKRPAEDLQTIYLPTVYVNFGSVDYLAKCILLFKFDIIKKIPGEVNMEMILSNANRTVLNLIGLVNLQIPGFAATQESADDAAVLYIYIVYMCWFLEQFKVKAINYMGTKSRSTVSMITMMTMIS